VNEPFPLSFALAVERAMALGRPRNEKRDLEILEAVLAGASLQSLARRDGLTFHRAQSILLAPRSSV
jgi:hypothetical protein